MNLSTLGMMVPKGEFLPLQHNDLISIGGDYGIDEAFCINSTKNSFEKAYLYQVKAPLSWKIIQEIDNPSIVKGNYVKARNFFYDLKFEIESKL